MIKSGSSYIAPLLQQLFNRILEQELYPNDLRTGYIVPIFKKGEHSDPANYRGISICNNISKLFAILLNTRLQTFLSSNNILSKFQNGFTKNKRTSDHVFVLKCLIEEAKSKRQPIFGCFVDLRKAFDSVWIEGLLYKMLYKYNISPKFVRILDSMYGNLKGCVCKDNKLSRCFEITIGTRKGCNLSPTLFNIFLNDFPSILEKGACHPASLNNMNINVLMYADDMLILSKSRAGLQRSLNILDVYCKKWKLAINTDKTKVMIFNKTKLGDLNFIMVAND